MTGVLVRQLVPDADAVELILGATTDPAFGSVVAFGTGGVLVEVLGDVTFRLAPVSAVEARSMVDATAAGRPAADRRAWPRAVPKDGVAAVIVRCPSCSPISRRSTSTRCWPKQGYWHTLVTPPLVFTRLVAEVVGEYRLRGVHKPVVASLSGDVEVEAASAYLFEHGIAAYPYTTELPVAVLGAKYRWAR